MVLIFLTAIIFWTAHPTFAADYEVTHLEPKRIFKGTTLFADISDREWPRVVEVDFNGNIVWEYRPLESGAILDAAKLKNGNILITIRGSGIYEVTRDGKVVWEHEEPGASHDADRLPNGNTLYNLGWSAKGEDVVREIDPNGKIVSKHVDIRLPKGPKAHKVRDANKANKKHETQTAPERKKTNLGPKKLNNLPAKVQKLQAND